MTNAVTGHDAPRGLRALQRDVRAARERDPAARSALEVALCYPGVHAIWGYRVTHWLWARQLRLPARLLSEIVRVFTGVDIHPGASLGPGLFIDHATGVVIGETAQVGADVTMYQGVTLGATSRDRGKRHPTIGDRVVIGAGAKVLGPVTIGAGAVIGANAVVVKPVPPGAVVAGVPGQIIRVADPDAVRLHPSTATEVLLNAGTPVLRPRLPRDPRRRPRPLPPAARRALLQRVGRVHRGRHRR